MSAAAFSPLVGAKNIQSVESQADSWRWFVDTAVAWLPTLVVILRVFVSLWVPRGLAAGEALEEPVAEQEASKDESE